MTRQLHADIISDILRAINLREAPTTIVKVKSHRLLSTAESRFDALCVFGNNAADAQAKEALGLHPVIADGDALDKKATVASDLVARFLAFTAVKFASIWGQFPKAEPTTDGDVRLAGLPRFRA